MFTQIGMKVQFRNYINPGDEMKAWEKLYRVKDLDEAVTLADNIKIISNDGVQIIAQVGDFKVETYIQYASPSCPSCSCSSVYSCKHEAAIVYYLKNHPELYLENQSINEVFYIITDDELKDFLKDEFQLNPDLKDRFLKRFSDNSIDKNYYNNKLSKIFRKGGGRDFEYHGFYDLDRMEDGLYDFISSDISNILSAGEYDFACELMIRIAELLNDEVVSTHDSWYNLADRFMEQVNALSFSIYLDAEKMDELNANTGHITSIL